MFSRNSIPILPSTSSMKFNRIHVWFIAARKAIIPIQHAISWNQRIGRRGKTINRKPTRPLNFLLNHRISPPPPSFSPQCRHNNRLIWHCSKMSRFLCPSSRESDYYISSFSHRNCSPRLAPTISICNQTRYQGNIKFPCKCIPSQDFSSLDPIISSDNGIIIFGW